MNFKSHLHLKDRHAFLSASKSSWVNYDEEKLDRVYFASLAAQRGSEIHSFAYQAIRLGERLPQRRKSLNMYVNDAIGYRMTPEQPLYYSENCFGHADTISFRRNKLRIHDLKTGSSPSSERQLEVYAALFCLEYLFRPFDIEFELRIYQNDEIRRYHTDPARIAQIMDKIRVFDQRIKEIQSEVVL